MLTPWRGGGKPVLVGFRLAAVGQEQAAPAVLNSAHGVTTGYQCRSASRCADVDRDRDDRALYGGEHALPADVTIGTAVCLNGAKWRAALSLDFSPSLVVYHINCHPVIENQALRVLPNWRESADQVFCRDKCDSSSVFIFVYTIHRWVKSKHCIRSFGFWLALSSGPPTGPQPTAIQHVVQAVMGIVKIITDTYMVMLKTFEVLPVWMTSI